MRPDEYARHDGTALAALLRRREVSPTEVLEAAVGLIEARNSELGLFGVERLCRSLESVAQHPATLIRDHILAELTSWTTRQRDDLTLVVLRYGAAV